MRLEDSAIQDGRRAESRERLRELLRELFQFDASDLDFGVYHVLNQRRDEIDRFIEEDLLDAVDDGLSDLADARRREIRAEIVAKRQAVIENLGEEVITSDGGIDSDYAPLNIPVINEYQQTREKLEGVAVRNETEARVFNDLYRFFSRYYEAGDFHTQRRISSRDAKYAVPYNGEEVHFHWANHDQYYVKTGKHFTDYRFRASDYTVQFRLEAADVPQDDVKGDDRYFVLGSGDPVSFDPDEETCTIAFQYRKISEDEAEDFVETYNEAAGDDRGSFTYMTNAMRCTALESRILDRVENDEITDVLTAPEDSENEDSPTRLSYNLKRYTSENTMDYFVHKNLSDFLHRELDFFLKNEVLAVDDLLRNGNSETPAVLRARTIRTIAARIIAFLAQIEEFQKRLFEKKKFVVQTDYMVTLDHVPESLYAEVLANDEQLEQWREVYNTDEWDTDLRWQGTFDRTFLNNHPHAMVDTAFFGREFTLRLLASFDDLETSIGGVLVNGENFQTLNLLSQKYRNRIGCCYIDPPYNTGSDGFLYKDKYRHSCWLSLMSDRLERIHHILSDSSSIFISNDDHENNRLQLLLNDIFGSDNFVAEVIWQKVYSPKNSAKYFSEDHDYISVFSKNKDAWRPNLLPRSEEQNKRYKNPDNEARGPWKPSDLTARNSYSKGQYQVESPSGKVFSPSTGRYWSISRKKFRELDEDDRIWWGENSNNMPHLKRFLSEVQNGMVPQTLWEYDEVGHTQDAKKELLSFVDFERTEDVLNSVKPSSLIKRMLRIGTSNDSTDWMIDFFAGSGPTAHAAIDLNRDEESDRRYILVEVGDYFDTIIRPRLQRVVFSSEWDGGVPRSRNGVSHLIKYHRLESYEDTLNNITLREPDGSQQRFIDEEIDDYVEGYLLDFESQDSAPLLPEGTFDEPFCHQLDIERDGVSREPTAVDLVETFHYLVGADVRQYDHREHQGREYVITTCDVDSESGVERVMTVWRRTADLDLEVEAEWFAAEFDERTPDRVYVNGESQIERGEPLEITFREAMEASPDVS